MTNPKPATPHPFRGLAPYLLLGVLLTAGYSVARTVQSLEGIPEVVLPVDMLRVLLTLACALSGFFFAWSASSWLGLAVGAAFSGVFAVAVAGTFLIPFASLPLVPGAREDGTALGLSAAAVAFHWRNVLVSSATASVILLVCLALLRNGVKVSNPATIVAAGVSGIFGGLAAATVASAYLAADPLVLLSAGMANGSILLRLLVLGAFATIFWVTRGLPDAFRSGVLGYLAIMALNLDPDAAPGDGERLGFGRFLEYVALAAIPFGLAHEGVLAMRRISAVGTAAEDPAQKDPLTGLFNRRALESLGAAIFDESHHAGRPVSALMIDIDHFKFVNDLHGHAAGDAVLRMFGAIIQRNVRSADLTARYGGEEFTVLLPGAHMAMAVKLGERIRTECQSTEVTYESARLKFTVSVGVATAFPGESNTLQSLIETADKCLYRAKRGGRNRTVSTPYDISSAVIAIESTE